jgi:hypothetical protein
MYMDAWDGKEGSPGTTGLEVRFNDTEGKKRDTYEILGKIGRSRWMSKQK